MLSSFAKFLNYLRIQSQFSKFHELFTYAAAIFVFLEVILHKYSVRGCIDVTRTTHTNLEVLQETRIDDCWKVDVDRNLSDSWTGFTKFTLERKTSKRPFVVRERLTQIQATTRPDYFAP